MGEPVKPLVRKAQTRAIPAILLGIVLTLLVLPMAADAAPSGTAVKVYKAPCRGGTCDSDDTPLSSGATVRGSIVITVASSSTVGLSSVDLEADGPDGSTVCLRHWDPNGSKSFSSSFTWDTASWPSAGQADGCSSSSSYGDVTANGSYTVRVNAEDTTGLASQTTSVRFDNPPETPTWSGNPTVTGDQDNPVVVVRWTKNPEPDVRSYDVIRHDPNGNKRTVRVDAADPSQQGCSRNGADYECQDANFPSTDWSGTYTYSLIAYREGAGGGTLPSPESGGRSVTLSEPPPPPPPSQSPEAGGGATGSPSASPDHSPTGSATSPSASPLAKATVEALRTLRSDNSEFFTGTFKKSLPYSSPEAFAPQRLGVRPSQTVVAESADGSPDDRSPLQVLVPVAGGLLALLGAGHILRVLTGR
jgi:hypothetical protein